MEEKNSATGANASARNSENVPVAFIMIGGAAIFTLESLTVFVQNLLSFLNIYGYIPGDTAWDI